MTIIKEKIEMSAERKNIVNRDRVDLHAVLPLETPFSLFIDVCNACNFKCKFCAIQTENIRKFQNIFRKTETKRYCSWSLVWGA